MQHSVATLRSMLLQQVRTCDVGVMKDVGAAGLFLWQDRADRLTASGQCWFCSARTIIFCNCLV